MKYVEEAGLWLPDDETHLLERHKRTGKPVYADYQQDRLAKAYPHVQDWEVAVDAGAHVGIFTRAFAAKFRRVIAFEPHPETYACLVKNTAHLPNVTAVHAALGRTSGTLRIEDRVGENTGDRQIAAGTGQGVTVPAYALDDYPLPDCNLLKIDVQGYEGELVAGAHATVSSFAPVIIVEQEPAAKLRHTFPQHGGAVLVLHTLGAKQVDLIGTDHILAFGPDGPNPYTKYARGDYHWQQYAGGKTKPLVDGVVTYVLAQQDGPIVELGCGDGLYASKLGALGVDSNKAAVKLARGHGVAARHMNLYRAYRLGQCGAVCMFDTLEHLHKPALALRVAAQLADVLYVLNPDPCRSKFHVREFTQEELPGFAAAEGWIHKHQLRFEVSKGMRKTLHHFVRAS